MEARTGSGLRRCPVVVLTIVLATVLLSGCGKGETTASTMTLPTGPIVLTLSQDNPSLGGVYEWCFSADAVLLVKHHLQKYGYEDAFSQADSWRNQADVWRDDHPDVWTRGCMGYLLLNIAREEATPIRNSIRAQLVEEYRPRTEQALTELSDVERVWCADHDERIWAAGSALNLMEVDGGYQFDGEKTQFDLSPIPNVDFTPIGIYDNIYDFWKVVEPEEWVRACSAAFGAR